MLQTQAVSPECLELLKNIVETETFSQFVLVGGTALALQIGHRNSIDLDFFGNCEIDADQFITELKNFGKVQILQKSKNVLILSVNGIKVDFVNYRYDWLEKFIELDGVRMASKKDIAAMKLNAISGRGSRKDFIDLYFLLNYYSLNEMMTFYDEKYEEGSYFLVLKSLNYFENADLQESPDIYLDFNWEEAKRKISYELFNL